MMTGACLHQPPAPFVLARTEVEIPPFHWRRRDTPTWRGPIDGMLTSCISSTHGDMR